MRILARDLDRDELSSRIQALLPAGESSAERAVVGQARDALGDAPRALGAPERPVVVAWTNLREAGRSALDEPLPGRKSGG